MQLLNVNHENKSVTVEINNETHDLKIDFFHDHGDEAGTLIFTEKAIAVKNTGGEKLHCASLTIRNDKLTGIDWSGRTGNGTGWRSNNFTVLGMAKNYKVEQFAKNSRKPAELAGAK